MRDGLGLFTWDVFESLVDQSIKYPDSPEFDGNMWSTYAVRYLMNNPGLAPRELRIAALNNAGNSNWHNPLHIPDIDAAELVIEELRKHFGHHDRDKIIQGLAVAYCEEANIEVPEAWADGWGM